MICINCRNEMKWYFTKKGFRIMRCVSCELLAVENVPEDLAPFYTAGYFTGDTRLEGYMDYDTDKEVTKATYIAYCDVIATLLHRQTDISVFEVGCATGFFLELVKNRGWVAEGMDISDFAAAKARAKGLAVCAGTLETFQPVRTYDCVSIQDVIEHVKDPVDFVTRARALLGTHGLLLVTTPDAGSLWARVWGKRWHAFVPPQHLFYFSVQNLSTLLEAHGFTVERVSHHGKRFSVPYIFRLLNTWTGIRLFARLAGFTAQTFLQHVAIPINVGDTIFLIARKT